MGRVRRRALATAWMSELALLVASAGVLWMLGNGLYSAWLFPMPGVRALDLTATLLRGVWSLLASATLGAIVLIPATKVGRAGARVAEQVGGLSSLVFATILVARAPGPDAIDLGAFGLPGWHVDVSPATACGCTLGGGERARGRMGE